MPWKCPACQMQIAHYGDAPEPWRVYRCHVCRLELILDEGSQKLTLAPLRTAAEPSSGNSDLGARSFAAGRFDDPSEEGTGP